ncbi:hypothetical protein AOLI_G00141280 [Acnodon oligacanthus]
MHAVRAESADLVSEPSEIHQQTVNFFSKLYKNEWAEAERWRRDSSASSHESLLQCWMRICLWRSCMRLSRAWRMVGRQVTMVSLLNFAILTLLPKKGDLTELMNWRPVSLLCTDSYADDLVVIASTQTGVDVLAGSLNDFRVLSSAEVNWTKSEAVLAGEWDGGEPALMWRRRGFKYLGVYLGGSTCSVQNWDGVVEKVKGRLSEWKWLVPQVSYRGRVLVIDNLAASSLWHNPAYVDPPLNLLVILQAVLVDFFWDRLHWLPQGVLHLPNEEGGQGLVHLASRTAAF